MTPETRSEGPLPESTGSSRGLMLAILAATLLMAIAGVSWVRALPRDWRCRTPISRWRCRHGGHEAAAIGALRTFNTAQSIYREEGMEVGDEWARYADSLAKLSAPGVDLIDDIVGTGMRQGYDYRLSASPDGLSWDAEAHPCDANAGNRRFYTNQTGTIWFSTANPTEPAPLNGGVGGVPDGFSPLGG